MRRLGYTEFGAASVLAWREVTTPMPGHGEVLVRTRAASINPTDTKVRSGELKALTLTRRKPYGMGMDVAGVVEAVGSGVRDVQIGDRVAGMTAAGDGFADATIVKAAALAPIPNAVDFVHAAGLAMSGATAVGIVEAMKPRRAATVLVSGGSGGIGQYLVRLLGLAGCRVEATGSASSADVLRRLGAIAHDYRSLDEGALAHRFDAVVDLSGAVHLGDAKPWLKRDATFFAVVPDATALLDQARTLAPFAHRRSRALMVLSTGARIRRAMTFAAAGSLPVVPGAVHPLSDAIEVLGRVESGAESVTGKVIFTAPDDAVL